MLFELFTTTTGTTASNYNYYNCFDFDLDNYIIVCGQNNNNYTKDSSSTNNNDTTTTAIEYNNDTNNNESITLFHKIPTDSNVVEDTDNNEDVKYLHPPEVNDDNYTLTTITTIRTIRTMEEEEETEDQNHEKNTENVFHDKNEYTKTTAIIEDVQSNALPQVQYDQDDTLLIEYDDHNSNNNTKDILDQSPTTTAGSSMTSKLVDVKLVPTEKFIESQTINTTATTATSTCMDKTMIWDTAAVNTTTDKVVPTNSTTNEIFPIIIEKQQQPQQHQQQQFGNNNDNLVYTTILDPIKTITTSNSTSTTTFPAPAPALALALAPALAPTGINAQSQKTINPKDNSYFCKRWIDNLSTTKIYSNDDSDNNKNIDQQQSSLNFTTNTNTNTNNFTNTKHILVSTPIIRKKNNSIIVKNEFLKKIKKELEIKFNNNKRRNYDSTNIKSKDGDVRKDISTTSKSTSTSITPVKDPENTFLPEILPTLNEEPGQVLVDEGMDDNSNIEKKKGIVQTTSFSTSTSNNNIKNNNIPIVAVSSIQQQEIATATTTKIDVKSRIKNMLKSNKYNHVLKQSTYQNSVHRQQSLNDGDNNTKKNNDNNKNISSITSVIVQQQPVQDDEIKQINKAVVEVLPTKKVEEDDDDLVQKKNNDSNKSEPSMGMRDAMIKSNYNNEINNYNNNNTIAEQNSEGNCNNNNNNTFNNNIITSASTAEDEETILIFTDEIHQSIKQQIQQPVLSMSFDTYFDKDNTTTTNSSKVSLQDRYHIVDDNNIKSVVAPVSVSSFAYREVDDEFALQHVTYSCNNNISNTDIELQKIRTGSFVDDQDIINNDDDDAVTRSAIPLDKGTTVTTIDNNVVQDNNNNKNEEAREEEVEQRDDTITPKKKHVRFRSSISIQSFEDWGNICTGSRQQFVDNTIQKQQQQQRQQQDYNVVDDNNEENLPTNRCLFPLSCTNPQSHVIHTAACTGSTEQQKQQQQQPKQQEQLKFIIDNNKDIDTNKSTTSTTNEQTKNSVFVLSKKLVKSFPINVATKISRTTTPTATTTMPKMTPTKRKGIVPVFISNNKSKS